MNLKQLMKKVETANEVCRFANARFKFIVYIDIDGLGLKNVNGDHFFEKWDNVAVTIADEYVEAVCASISPAKLTKKENGTFYAYIESTDTTIEVTIDRYWW